jgi:hypothetical protein
VTGVIVVWGDFAEIVDGDRVTFVPGDQLATWLRARPATMSAAVQTRAAAAVASLKDARETEHGECLAA